MQHHREAYRPSAPTGSTAWRVPPQGGDTPPPGLRARDRAALALAAIGLPVTYMLLAPSAHAEHVVLIGLSAIALVVAAWTVARHGLPGGLATAAALTVALLVTRRAGGLAVRPLREELLVLVLLAWAAGLGGGVLADGHRARQRWAARRQRARERRSMLEALASLAAALGSHDPETERHGQRVGALAAALARNLGLSGDAVETARLAGLVHDIGKLGVPCDVLLKPAALDAAERRAVERHPDIAAAILAPLRGVEPIAEAVRAHHECPDGSGYPRGLAGAQIPITARVLQVADVFCALLEKRPYKRPQSVEAVLGTMRPLAGTKLDSAAFGALERLLAGVAPGGAPPYLAAE